MHKLRMPLQGNDLPAGLGVPDPGGVVPRSGEDVPAIRAEHSTPHRASMPREEKALLKTLMCVEQNCLCLGCIGALKATLIIRQGLKGKQHGCSYITSSDMLVRQIRQ